jgi:hypothetical protein
MTLEERITLARDTIYVNNLYQVNVSDAEVGEGWPEMWHLSVKRRDKAPIRDWRHMQRIKNEIVGEDHEGVELYPAEDRLVDAANQFHMWVLKDPERRWPFGFHEGRQVDYEGPAGGRQRGREDD